MVCELLFLVNSTFVSNRLGNIGLSFVSVSTVVEIKRSYPLVCSELCTHLISGCSESIPASIFLSLQTIVR